MVAPILLYGAEVWGYEKNDIAETLHLEFCKYIMKVKKCTPNYIVYGELGRLPMSVLISTFRCIKDLQFPILNIRIKKVLLNFLR
jgi:hypothetical protein